MTFSPLSSVIRQYAPALGSVTNRPTFGMVASSGEEPLGENDECERNREHAPGEHDALVSLLHC
jgi:hypothetical protein